MNPVAELPLPGCQTHMSISVHHSWPLAATTCLNAIQEPLLGCCCRWMCIPGQHLKHSSRDRPQIVAFIAPARQALSHAICWAVLSHLTKTQESASQSLGWSPKQLSLHIPEICMWSETGWSLYAESCNYSSKSFWQKHNWSLPLPIWFRAFPKLQ